MKKLLAVLMIAGLFGFASCGGEKKADDAAMSADTTAAAPATDASTMSAAPADTAAAMPADTTAH